MDEQRLIDANKIPKCVFYSTWDGKGIASICDVPYSQIENAPTIDPESLPIVRQLRAELDKVTAERDALLHDIQEIMFIGGGNMDTCRYCKNAKCTGRGGRELCDPKWRGPRKEE